MVLRFLVVALALQAGCQRHIGDSCKTNAECSALGDRFCDTSVRGTFNDGGQETVSGGYCTVEGCDVRVDTENNAIDSCPTEAVCVRFFLAGVKRCNVPPTAPACDPAQRCVCDCPDRDGTCLNSFVSAADPGAVSCDGNGARPLGDKGEITVGRCAPEASERRWCMRRCDSDGDCRDPRCSDPKKPSGPCYECRPFGNGAVPVSLPSWAKRPTDHPKFCVQRGG